MNDYLKVAALAASVVAIAFVGTWLARNSPWRGSRTTAALISTFHTSFWSLDVGYRLSDPRGPWLVEPGYSCRETKILAFILLYGGVLLIRVVWQSIRAEGEAAARATKLALACLGLALTGFTFSESEKAHDRFHQVQHQSETHR